MSGTDAPTKSIGEPILWRCPTSYRIANLTEVERFVRSLPATQGSSLLALYVDSESNLLATEMLAGGDGIEGGIKPMRIIKQAQQLGAIGFIIVACNPARLSGPRSEELRFARDLRRTGEDFDIYLLHYIILGSGRTREVAA